MEIYESLWMLQNTTVCDYLTSININNPLWDRSSKLEFLDNRVMRHYLALVKVVKEKQCDRFWLKAYNEHGLTPNFTNCLKINLFTLIFWAVALTWRARDAAIMYFYKVKHAEFASYKWWLISAVVLFFNS